MYEIAAGRGLYGQASEFTVPNKVWVVTIAGVAVRRQEVVNDNDSGD